MIAHQRLPQSATATTEQNDHLLCGSKVVMKCKMWCLDFGAQRSGPGVCIANQRSSCSIWHGTSWIPGA